MEETEKFIEPEMTFGEELRFTPYAWAKLVWMMNRGSTEVAGYGVTATKDPLLITDFVLIKQKCTSVSFDLDQNDIAEYVERMTDNGLPAWAYMNILCHSHPGNDPSPSGVDEDNFEEAFSHPHWAIMFIIAKNGETYCRIKTNVGPGVTKELNVTIDYGETFPGTDIKSWNEEYKSNVTEVKFLMTGAEDVCFSDQDDPMWWNEEEEIWENSNKASENAQNNLPNEDMEDIDCHWDSDGNVSYWDGKDDIWYIYNPIKEKWYQEDFGNDMPKEITKPNRPWADAVILWASQYANERVLSMEN